MKNMPVNKNIMTCDLEDWYHPSLIGADISQWDSFDSRILEPAEEILAIFRKNNCTATFFVLGHVAEKFPELIKKIHAEGHEIASHGYAHKLVYNQSPEEFRSDLQRSLKVLAELTGERIRGYRAPSWSARKEFEWFWRILAEEGIEYDSSLFPFKTFLYGDNEVPTCIHRYSVDQERTIVEIPPSVMHFSGKRIPFSGGFFLRTMPVIFVRYFIKNNNKYGKPVVVYFHPWEFDAEQPRIKIKYRDYFIQYANIKIMHGKIEKISKDFSFTSIKNYLSQNGELN